MSLFHFSDNHFRPWPYIDSLDDQETEEVIDAKILNIIGSCGHDDCEDCRQWIAYPQSLFGNWTKKPVRKCGIERAVMDREHSSTIYTVDVLENGVFGDSGEERVTTSNKRQYWRNSLQPEVSIDLCIITIMSELFVSVRAEYVYVHYSWTRCRVPSSRCLAPGQSSSPNVYIYHESLTQAQQIYRRAVLFQF